jgi:hypothetical protein
VSNKTCDIKIMRCHRNLHHRPSESSTDRCKAYCFGLLTSPGYLFIDVAGHSEWVVLIGRAVIRWFTSTPNLCPNCVAVIRGADCNFFRCCLRKKLFKMPNRTRNRINNSTSQKQSLQESGVGSENGRFMCVRRCFHSLMKIKLSSVV